MSDEQREITVRPTPEEWERALRLTEKGRSTVKKAVYSVLLAGAAVSFTVGAVSQPEIQKGGWLFAAVALLLIVAVWVTPVIRRRQALRSTEEAPPLHITLTRDSISFAGDDTAYAYEQLPAVTDGAVWAIPLADCLVALPVRVLEPEWAAFLNEKWAKPGEEVTEP